MEDHFSAFIGIVLMLGFAGGLAWKVGALPLLVITGLVLLMVVVDTVRTLRQGP